MNRLFRLILIVGLLFAALGGPHAAMAGSMVVGESEHAFVEAHDHGQAKDDRGHCPDKQANFDQAGHAGSCCTAGCGAFQLVEAQSWDFHRFPIEVSIPWIVNSAEGLRPESIYRPPEA